MEAAAYLTHRHTLRQGTADICIVTRQAEVRVSGSTAFGTPESFALRAETVQRLFGALGDKVALYLGGQPEGKGKYLALYVIPKPIAVLDSPDATLLVHADTENLHYHVEVASETGQLAADDDVLFLYLAQQPAQLTLVVTLGARDGLLYPSVHAEVLLLTKPLYLKTLVLYGLLVRTDTNISVYHFLLIKIRKK